MSNIWKFSPSSEPLIQKLIETAKKVESNNKWSEKFKHLPKTYLELSNVQNKEENKETEYNQNVSPKIVICEKEDHPDKTEIDQLCETNHNFFDIIEAESTSRLEYVIEECVKDPSLINKLVQLPINSLENISNAIFARSDVPEEFISLFCHNFLPEFLKRDQSWIALDMLHKAYKKFPERFTSVLNKLIHDLNIPNSILQEFVQSSNTELQKEFLYIIMHINFTPELFKHHLFTLYLVYKDCLKIENIQSFIQSKLAENALECANEKDYGRLLLLLLQTQKLQGFPTNLTMLERIVELHKSVFKRPCSTILNEIAEKQVTDQT